MITKQPNSRSTSLLGRNHYGFPVMLFLLFFTVLTAFPQTDWTKYQGNPIMGPGPEGAWDDQSIGGCSVLLDGSVFHMWYGGFDGANYRIGHATSSDGQNWIKDANNPVLDTGSAGSWDGIYVYSPCVVKVGSTFHLFYDGSDLGTENMGHATSQDGITWTKDPLNPVLQVGPEGSWDEYQVFPMAGSVIHDGSIFKMWYGGGNSYYRWRIGYATSSDGVTWIKDEEHNPVLNSSETGEWDGHSVLPCSVINDGTGYHMWYCGFVIDDYKWRTGYATSPDGINWTKDTINNPVIDWGPAGSWDQDLVFDGSVIYNSTDQSFKMWYTGGQFFSQGSIGYATSNFTGMNEHQFQIPGSGFQISCYPNPTGGIVNLHFTVYDLQSVMVKIYDVHGREVAVVVDGKWTGDQVVRWDASGLPAGIYYYRMTVGGQRSAVGGKILVQH